MYRKNKMKTCCLTAALSLSVALSACSGRDVSVDADNSPQGSFSEIQNSDLQGADGKEEPETVSEALSL